LTFPATVTGTVNSGGIPYFNSTAQLSSSAVLLSGGLIVGGGAGAAPNTITLGGDCSFTSPNLTCTKTNGVAFGTAATQNTGTSGATLGFLNGNNTFSGTNTYSGSGTFSGSVNFTSAFKINSNTITWPASATTVAALNIADQNLSGGANVTSLAQSTGSITVDCGSRPIQTITDNGAYTITAPSNDGYCLLKVTNGATAGATTFSGFLVGSNTGDSLDTTSGHKFIISVIRAGGDSTYTVKALQ
jgi:hypothetical protein